MANANFAAPPMPTCSAPPPATASGSPIPTLLIEVERDFTLYGEEVKFGGGKVIRDGMGQSQATARRAPPIRSSPMR